MRSTRRADDTGCARSWLGQVGGQKLSRGREVLVGYLDPNATYGIRVKPIHLDDVIILNEGWNTCGL